MEKTKEKLYAYVDESRQDTRGRFFLVAVVITEQERDVLRRQLAEIERTSGKETHKWTKTRRNIGCSTSKRYC